MIFLTPALWPSFLFLPCSYVLNHHLIVAFALTPSSESIVSSCTWQKDNRSPIIWHLVHDLSITVSSTTCETS